MSIECHRGGVLSADSHQLGVGWEQKDGTHKLISEDAQLDKFKDQGRAGDRVSYAQKRYDRHSASTITPDW